MKSIILAAVAALSVVAGTVSANADPFPVHGYQGTHYGR